MPELKYPLFDGERLWDGACVTVSDGRIISVTACAPSECGDGFLMPALIDAHTHMESMSQVESMLKCGIAATCDVNGSQSLIRSSKQLRIVSSAGMIMGRTLNPKNTVARYRDAGAQYIKVLLFNPLAVGKRTLSGIVDAAHEQNLKVVVHATSVATVKQAVEAGADILLHMPMKEEYPVGLAETIARKGISVAPTLVMMETFSQSGRNGYRPEHYENARKAVNLLYKTGVRILAATDANSGSFAPGVSFGPSMHREMELLVDAGMTPTEVLASATSVNADLFGMSDTGLIKAGKRADLLLIDGRPDEVITDTAKIRQMWIGGESVCCS